MTLDNFFFISGPCLIESKDLIFEVADELAKIKLKLGVQIILKGSFKKANRTGLSGTMTTGEESALQNLAEAGAKYFLPTITDIHSELDARLASTYVDVLQIPAFLCRQTELIQAAAATGKWVNIKKGQFMAPEDMVYAVQKAKATGNDKVILCERGTTFGYHNLVVDMRGLVTMRNAKVPVIYDATHSLQLPSGAGGKSGGTPELILPMAKAAVAVGIDGVFFETHPNPAQALSDAATQLPLIKAENFITQILELNNYIKKSNSV